MILITGATGQYGTKTIEHLLKKGVDVSQLSALVRSAEKGKELEGKGVTLRVGDYKNYESLLKAFQGVDKLLLVSSNDKEAIENRTAQHIQVIGAAKEAGVNHIVYTSFTRKPGFGDSAIAAFQESHVKTEQCIKDSGLDYTILQNGIYLEMIPVFAGAKVADTGVILFPAGEGKASFVLREELAETAAHVLTTDGHENKIYPLTNTEAVSFEGIASLLSGTLGKDIQYQSPATDAFQSILKQAGVPALYIGLLTDWSLAQAQGALDLTDTTLMSFLGRKPTTAKDFIDQVYGQGRP
jgi:NAD(P)H dehydrogenase (quinone)